MVSEPCGQKVCINACVYMHLVSGRQNECVCVTKQDGLPARPVSSLVSRAYCHDNILHITQQSHRAARLLLSPLSWRFHCILTLSVSKAPFCSWISRLLTAHNKIAFCLDNYSVFETCMNIFFLKLHIQSNANGNSCSSSSRALGAPITWVWYPGNAMHELIKCTPWMQCKTILIKVSSKCINVNESIWNHFLKLKPMTFLHLVYVLSTLFE